MDNIASRRTGIKLLDNNQILSSFPLYGNFQNRIKLIREYVKGLYEINSSENISERDYTRYENTFSIFGERGSGKTSVLFSFIKSLERNQKATGDIVIPFISPEIISASRDCSLLGWVITSFSDVVDDIEKRLKELEYAEHRNKQAYFEGFFTNCRLASKNPLRDAYEKVQKSIFSVGSKSHNNYSYYEEINLKSDLSKKQFDLMDSIQVFFNTLVGTSRKIALSSGRDSTSVNPLIFISFDDFDLSPNYGVELLTSTIRYLANPYVVVIIACNQIDLEKMLETHMYKEMIGSNFPSQIQNLTLELQKKETKRTNDELLFTYKMLTEREKQFFDKVIPAANRYRLISFETIQRKQEFCYSNKNNDYAFRDYNPEKPDSQLLSDVIQRQFDNFAKTAGAKYEIKFVNYDLLIFGRESRYITSATIGIMDSLDIMADILKNKENENKDEQNIKLLNQIRGLCVVLISSNPLVSKYYENVDEFILPNKNGFDFYINFPYLLDLYLSSNESIYSPNKKKIDIKEYQENKKKFGVLFCILSFIEKIVSIFQPNHRELHGHKEIITFLNSTYPSNENSFSLKLFSSINGKRNRLMNIYRMYAFLIEKPELYVYNDWTSKTYVKRFLRAIESNDTFLKKLSAENISRLEDKRWAKSYISLLFMEHSGLLNVDIRGNKKFINIYQDFWIWNIKNSLIEHTNTDFKAFLMADNKREYSIRLIENYINIKPSDNFEDDNSLYKDISNKNRRFSEYYKHNYESLNDNLDKFLAYKKFKLCFQNQPSYASIVFELESLITNLHENCIRLIEDNWFYIKIPNKAGSKVISAVAELSESFPDSPYIHLFNYLQKNYNQNELIIPLGFIYSFLTYIHSKVEKRPGFYIHYMDHLSNLHFLVDLCDFYEINAQKESEISPLQEFILSAMLISYVAKYYFAIIFIVENDVDVSHDAYEKSDKENQSTLKQIYNNYVKTTNNNDFFNLYNDAKQIALDLLESEKEDDLK